MEDRKTQTLTRMLKVTLQ